MRYDVGRFRRPMRRSTEGQLMSLISLGDGSTLTLDFTQGVLDSRLTFTRASTATFINSSGLVASAPTNVARFDYDPTTLAAKGLLIEGSATNLLNFSESFATSGGTDNDWIDTDITRTSVNNADPAGGTTALRITASSPNGTMISSNQVNPNDDRTFSVWLRRVTGTGDIQITLDGGLSWTTQAITSSWVRYQFADYGRQTCGILIADAGDAIEIWGAQLEVSDVGASSYIPTNAEQVTRYSDECSMTGTNFSSWFNATTGTVLAHGSRRQTANFGRLASINDNTTNESFDLGGINTGRWTIRVGGSAVANIAPGTVTANTAFKVAGAFAVNDAQAACNGTLGTADTSLALPTVTQLMIGRQPGASPVYLDGTISLLKFWPTRLPNATLQSLTT